MADPTTTNRGYAVPTRGSDVGTWDIPLNTNFGALDNNLGGVASIALSNAAVTLTSDQYQCGTIRLTGALTANVTITFPAVSGWWTIDNQTTGAFVALLTCGTGNNIATEPGCATDIFTDGTNVAFRALGKIGGYWDYAGSAVPLWVQACTIPPYLYCNGTTFSATTYPYLDGVLGGATLPDFRGRNAVYLNAGTGRTTAGGAGLDGDTLYAGGGINGLTAGNLPQHSHPNSLNDPGHQHASVVTASLIPAGVGLAGSSSNSLINNGATAFAGTGMSINNAINPTGVSVMPNAAPSIVSGIRMIRAA